MGIVSRAAVVAAASFLAVGLTACGSTGGDYVPSAEAPVESSSSTLRPLSVDEYPSECPNMTSAGPCVSAPPTDGPEGLNGMLPLDDTDIQALCIDDRSFCDDMVGGPAEAQLTPLYLTPDNGDLAFAMRPGMVGTFAPGAAVDSYDASIVSASQRGDGYAATFKAVGPGTTTLVALFEGSGPRVYNVTVSDEGTFIEPSPMPSPAWDEVTAEWNAGAEEIAEWRRLDELAGGPLMTTQVLDAAGNRISFREFLTQWLEAESVATN